VRSRAIENCSSKTRTKPSRTRVRGTTLVEIMVAISILAILSVIFAVIFNQARTSAEGGGARIAARSTHRQAQQRLTLILRSAVPPNEVDPAIDSPLPGEADAEVRFYAPVNLLDPTLLFEARTPDYPLFQIRRQPSDGALLVQRADGNGVQQRIGRDFESVNFRREDERTLEVTLTSEMTVRGASGSRKTIQESSQSVIRVLTIR
jgi:prepilin-type N-terminal cleavage/methylation domain-containing protein